MSTILIDQDGYKLTSYGDGSAYALEHDGRGAFMQGDDATQLRDEIEAFELAWPCASRATLARFLWMTLEYGLASTPLETI
jgi:phenylalanine-4-hydroxylase